MTSPYLEMRRRTLPKAFNHAYPVVTHRHYLLARQIVVARHLETGCILVAAAAIVHGPHMMRFDMAFVARTIIPKADAQMGANPAQMIRT